MTRMMSTLSEGLGVPCFVIAPYPMPYFPTRCFPFPFQTDTLIPEQIDTRIRQTWLQGRKLLGNFAQPVIDAWRKRLGLPVSTWQAELRHLRRIPHLLGFSSLVLPRPHDWPPNVQTTGFWALPAPRNYQPPPDLSNFLATGPPPVVFSFSSQVSRQPAEMTSAVLTAIEQTGVRGLLLAGWGGLRARHLPASVMQVPYVPHDWLFPQVAGVVHHGGCGSTAAALRAGVPNMAVTFGYDQPLWGQQLARLGVGPEPIPASKLTAERLSRAIHEMIANPKLRLAAKQLAPSFRAEDGVENAIAAVHTHLKRPQPCMC
jgi:UDP:flavonoid glycosyltransferase YjiC (YdhE family)